MRRADRLCTRELPDLQRIGAVPTHLRARAAVPGTSLNLLNAPAGALDGTDWRQVKHSRRLELLMQVEAHAQPRPPRDQRRAAPHRPRGLPRPAARFSWKDHP
ncbi:MAG: TfoX/Sxy family DNA transformation protein [Betaproteobacteria bacterium]